MKGKRIRDIRLEKGMSQHELAALVGVSSNTISGYETTGRLPTNMVGKLCNALDVSPNYLLGVASTYDGSDLSVGEKKFLTKYRSLPEESQEYVSQLTDMIYKIESKSSEKAE